MKADPERPSFVASSGSYFVAQLLGIAAGFISLPITTRLLNKDEYGVLSLVFATTALLGIFGRLGFAQATTRFYTEESKGGPQSLRHFCETMLTGALLGSVLVAGLAAVGFTWMMKDQQSSYPCCMRLACVLVVIRVVSAVFFQMYRAPERVLAYSTAQVLGRYGTLVLAVGFLLYYEASAHAVILATLTAEGIVAGICLADFVRHGLLSRLRFSWPTVAAATAYGTPLTVAGSASLILQYGDRFLIGRLLGVAAVATYSVPYDLTQSVGEALFGPVRTAAMPVIFRKWALDGPEATSRFTSQLGSYVIAVGIPLFSLFFIMSNDLIFLFASAKYRTSSALIPYLLPGIACDQLSFLLAWGLRVKKETIAAAAITLCGAVLNVVLNVALLPVWGLRGAALATTVSYAAIATALYVTSRDVLAIKLDYSLIGKVLLATLAMVVLLLGVGPVGSVPAVDVVARGVLGAATVAAGICLLDRGVRSHAWLFLRVRVVTANTE